MNRILLSVVSLSLSFSAIAADKAPAPKAACTCASHAEKCTGDCCSACRGDKSCTCATTGCKDCPTCAGKPSRP